MAAQLCTTTRPILTLAAPGLRPLFEALERLNRDPEDRRAAIQRALLAKADLDRCPRCQSGFSAGDLSETRGCGQHRRALICTGCQTRFVVEDQQIA